MSDDEHSVGQVATAHITGGSRKLGYFLAFIAFLTCPCHLPIWLMLFAGSAFGALLSENLIIAGVILVLLFVLCGAGALGRLKNG